jgi:hypothetical protein
MSSPSPEELKKLNEYLDSLDPNDVSVVVDTTDVGDINITVTPKVISLVNDKNNNTRFTFSLAFMILISVIILFLLLSPRK